MVLLVYHYFITVIKVKFPASYQFNSHTRTHTPPHSITRRRVTLLASTLKPLTQGNIVTESHPEHEVNVFVAVLSAPSLTTAFTLLTVSQAAHQER